MLKVKPNKQVKTQKGSSQNYKQANKRDLSVQGIKKSEPNETSKALLASNAAPSNINPIQAAKILKSHLKGSEQLTKKDLIAISKDKSSSNKLRNAASIFSKEDIFFNVADKSIKEKGDKKLNVKELEAFTKKYSFLKNAYKNKPDNSEETIYKNVDKYFDFINSAGNYKTNSTIDSFDLYGLESSTLIPKELKSIIKDLTNQQKFMDALDNIDEFDMEFSKGDVKRAINYLSNDTGTNDPIVQEKMLKMFDNNKNGLIDGTEKIELCGIKDLDKNGIFDVQEVANYEKNMEIIDPSAYDCVGESYSQNFIRDVFKALNKYEDEIKNFFISNRGSLKIGKTILDMFPDLVGQQPRGWSQGLTYANVRGLALGNQAYVAALYEDKTSKSYVENNRVEAIIGHEIGHALDYNLGLSTSNQFRTAYASDLVNMPPEIQNKLKYLIQNENNNGLPTIAGMQETVAEFLSIIMIGKGAAEIDEDMRTYFANALEVLPNLIDQNMKQGLKFKRFELPNK